MKDFSSISDALKALEAQTGQTAFVRSLRFSVDVDMGGNEEVSGYTVEIGTTVDRSATRSARSSTSRISQLPKT